jgi:hypothetical protein
MEILKQNIDKITTGSLTEYISNFINKIERMPISNENKLEILKELSLQDVKSMHNDELVLIIANLTMCATNIFNRLENIKQKTLSSKITALYTIIITPAEMILLKHIFPYIAFSEYNKYINKTMYKGEYYFLITI